jgi:2-(1,2-epoxy-1,2-dihydrophenyl)acetyl-CoA isomerase
MTPETTGEAVAQLAAGGDALATHAPVSIVLDGAILRITLDRPSKLNALTSQMLRTLHGAFAQARDDGAIRCVLLTGTGRAFCAGQDLGVLPHEINDPSADLGAILEEDYNPTIRLIRDLEKPVVCAVNGVAAGAGASLALAGDIVLAACSARFMFPFAGIGLVPDSGSSWLLTHLLGEARAKALSLMSEPLSAAQAAQWGLIWKTMDDERLMLEAEGLAQKLADGPTRALGQTKMLIQKASTGTFADQLGLERDYQRQAGRNNEHREGLCAYREKRSPNFSQR